MRNYRLVLTLFTFASAAVCVAPAAGAQGGLFGRIKEKAKEKIQQQADQSADSITDAAYDKGSQVFKCALGDEACVKKAEAAGKPVSVVNAQGQPVSTADSAAAIAQASGTAGAAAQPSLSSVETHSDFKQGERVIYQTNFTDATIGDFPRNIELKSGNVETVAFAGQKLLRGTNSTTLAIPLPEVLPQRFTMEFDYSGAEGWDIEVSFADPDQPSSAPSGTVSYSVSGEADINPSHGATSGSNIGTDFVGKLVHCQVMADSNYVKVYINGVRAGQSPNAPLGRSNKIYVTFAASESSPTYFGNIRVGAGGRDMYEALNTDGRFTTHGILFATGSAAIDPGSAATLTQIGQMLQQHADLKLEIDGHTDNVGSAASNQTLSEKRAAAVKAYLVSNFKVDGSRLSSKGYGASKPVASNATEDGKQQNRRVELVKM